MHYNNYKMEVMKNIIIIYKNSFKITLKKFVINAQ